MPIAFLDTVLCALFVVIVSPVSKRLANFIAIFWAKVIKFFVPMIVKKVGTQNIDHKQSYVIAVNHQSPFDIVLIYSSLDVDFRWFMKYELRNVPILGYACERLGHIFVNRQSKFAAYRSIQRAKETLVGGVSVVIFPEGTRTYSNNLRQFKHGAFKMALELDLPILPVTIKDTHKVMGKSILSLRPHRVTLTIHEPIDINKYSVENRDELIDNTFNVINSALK